MEGMDDLVFGSRVRIGKVVGAEADGITDKDGTGLPCEDAVTVVVIEGLAKVEAFKHAKVPGVAD